MWFPVKTFALIKVSNNISTELRHVYGSNSYKISCKHGFLFWSIYLSDYTITHSWAIRFHFSGKTASKRYRKAQNIEWTEFAPTEASRIRLPNRSNMQTTSTTIDFTPQQQTKQNQGGVGFKNDVHPIWNQDGSGPNCFEEKSIDSGNILWRCSKWILHWKRKAG